MSSFAGGQQHFAAMTTGGAPSLQVLDWTVSSQQQHAAHDARMLDLEVQRVAATLVVPTLPEQVRHALRQLGCPVRLFGENLANVRERLRIELARKQVLERGISSSSLVLSGEGVKKEEKDEEEEEEEVTKYTRASSALIEARQEICRFSLQRAHVRLERERRLRALAAAAQQRDRLRNKRKLVHSTGGATRENDKEEEEEDDDKEKDEEENSKPAAETELSLLDRQCVKLYKHVRQRVALEGSQYGDSRVLSCICAGTDYSAGERIVPGMDLVATGSWTGSLHVWDASSAALPSLGKQTQCHEDRIMGLAMIPFHEEGSSAMETATTGTVAMIATASIDKSAKLWKVKKTAVVREEKNESAMKIDDDKDDMQQQQHAFSITEMAHLQGHAARLCRVAFHPLRKHVATTSFDHSWRLWDVETSQNILLQDGHWKEVYGIGFHPDGSLCSTTDFAGVVQVWDLRTGKSITHHCAHAKRVLDTTFAPNGFHLATAGDDGTIKLFDLRRNKFAVAAIPAHTNVITTLKFDLTGEYLVSSSFDGTAKVWASRNWKMLKQLQGHEGKVTGIDILSDNRSFVTTGFDKTLKLWRS